MVAKSKRANIPGPIPMADRDWQAESDYGSLCRAAEVAADKKRLAAAIKYGETHMKETESFLAQVTKATKTTASTKY